ncbi:laccase-14 [Quercus suber]|uniref:laccase n=1 Tax=Quercus suber TaxID=58331 RepID=A0AAW0KZD1_QUESU
MNPKKKESLFLGSLFLAVQCLCMVKGDVHFYDFVLTEENFTRLCSTETMLAVNGSIPGPVLRVHKGDTMYVNVHNQGYYGVTIHWHGVKQPRNPWSDGTNYITQCPIEPGSNFTYEVIFSTEEGTLWWHAHSDWTRVGVHGSLYRGNLKSSLDDDLQSGIDLPHSVAYTINGEPGDLCPCSKETTYRWMVEYGKTYLVRLVNAAVSVDLFFAVAQHNLTVVGTDAHYTKPINTSYIMISPGQTMDILLTTNQSLGHYYIAARQFWSQDVPATLFDSVNATMILQYKGNYTIPSSPTFPRNLPFYKDLRSAITFTNLFKSLANKDYPVNVPLNITTRMFITLSMGGIIFHNLTSTLEAKATSANNISWSNPTTDILLAYYRNISGVYTTDFPDQPPSYFNFTGDDFPYTLTELGTKVKVLNYNEAVEMVFQSTNLVEGAGLHPMHLHGHSFYVVGSGPGIYDNVTDPKSFNLVDPVEVNTFGVPKEGWLAIRFVANNPGVWFWHCHLDRHMTWGMSSVFIVKNGDTTETSIRKPPPQLPLCEASFRLRLENIDGLDQGKENEPTFS